MSLPCFFFRPKQQQKKPAREQIQLADKDKDNCRVFVDRDGDMIRVMCCDYGFRTGSGRLYQEAYGEVPANVFVMVRLSHLSSTWVATAAG